MKKLKKAEHTPINYSVWNFNGQGDNLAKLFNPKERELWDANLSFIDKRDDLGHVEIVTYFAFKLLDTFPSTDRKVVIPAAILHDNGWSQMTKTELALFYESRDDGKGKEIWRRYEPVLRARHQEIGADLAEKILTDQDWPKENIPHICEIILGHDTRQGFYSPEDGIVRSADKLYRFTFPHLGQAIRNRKTWTIKRLNTLMGEWINEKGYFWQDSKKIKEIAQTERQNALEYSKREGKKTLQSWTQH